jgi:hypothetical protein
MGKNSKETAYQAVTTGILIYEADRETLLEYKSTLRMESDNICPDAKHRLAVPGRHSRAGDFYSLVRPEMTEKKHP